MSDLDRTRRPGTLADARRMLLNNREMTREDWRWVQDVIEEHHQRQIQQAVERDDPSPRDC